MSDTPDDPNHKPVSLDRLIKEAQEATYDPRAKKCWWWSHDWTMWSQCPSMNDYQSRRCLRCGKVKFVKMFAWHRHQWVNYRVDNVKIGDRHVGRLFYMRCRDCGEMAKRQLEIQ